MQPATMLYHSVFARGVPVLSFGFFFLLFVLYQLSFSFAVKNKTDVTYHLYVRDTVKA